MLYVGCQCDECHYVLEYKRLVREWLPSKNYLIRFAKDNGWSIGEQTLCPKCRKKIKYNRLY